MKKELPIHTPRPRPHRDPRRWLKQVADNHAIFYSDLPADVRAWGVERLMKMIKAGGFPRYHQIAPGGRRFWAGRDIKAWLAAHPAPPPLEPAEPDAAQDGERPS